MYREKIEAYFADKQDQIVADICRLIAVKSEREEAKPGMPFGEGPYNALMEGKKLAEEMGFFTKNFDTLRDKTLVLFSVGSGDPTVPDNVAHIRSGLRKVLTPEMEEKIRFFHVRGGVDYPNLKLSHKIMMAIFHKMMAKRGEDQNLDEYGTYIDYVDLDTIQPLIDYVKELG